MVLSAVPERRKLAIKNQELGEVLAREAEIRAEKEACEVQLHALREDPRFLEAMARDRLDYCMPGERVLRIQRAD